MQRHRLRAPSPALVISLLALFVALGGTSYAAINLPRNSVGAKQLKKNAVRTKKIKNGAVGAGKIKKNAIRTNKIKNGAVTAAKINPAGLTVPDATHATSADSATNASHATSADNATNASHATSADNATNASHATSAESATSASSASSPGPLGSGQTETGTVYALGAESSGGAYVGQAISFPFPLAAAPSTHVVDFGTTTSQCTGSPTNPTAAPGNLCLYVEATIGEATGGSIGFGYIKRWGVGVYMPTLAGSSYALLVARWAVTAP